MRKDDRVRLQQQISRLESPGYEGHSLSMLRRVAGVLHAQVRIAFEPAKTGNRMHVAEFAARYRGKRESSRRLARLGGSEKRLTRVPRRRPSGPA